MTSTHKAYCPPGNLTEYLPDPREPIDRWFQARNASNVRTTVRIVRDLCPTADLFVDPLAGGGSSACAARLLGLPFFGVELDPLLACVCLAKSAAEFDHVRAVPPRVSPDQPLASCLSVTRRLSEGTEHPVSEHEMLADLVAGPCATTGSHVLWGDATQAEIWDELHVQARHAVLYTSPPFDLSSPRPQALPGLRAEAELALAAAKAARSGIGPGAFASYDQIASAVVLRAAYRLQRLTVILEHEPADDGSDSRAPTIRRLTDKLGSRLRDVRILECGAYSRRGLFSLIVCEVAQ
ncbi:hypothetical protein [Streptomyces sp. NPDC047706]|uniref:hypothetical protein n=1 Tax=Streptomyces sp. NPDC047706 TaxID=3365486 RepID=UPI00371E1789